MYATPVFFFKGDVPAWPMSMNIIVPADCGRSEFTQT